MAHNVNVNMRDLGIERIAETDDIIKFWRDSYSAAPVMQAFVTYGMLRKCDDGGRTALKSWPQGNLPMAVQWDHDIKRLCNTEIVDRGTKFARYSPGRDIDPENDPRCIDLEMFRIAGVPEDVARYKKNLNSLEWQYKPVEIPVYRDVGGMYALDSTARLYLQNACQGGERPANADSAELREKLTEPFALINGNSTPNWFVGRRRPR